MRDRVPLDHTHTLEEDAGGGLVEKGEGRVRKYTPRIQGTAREPSFCAINDSLWKIMAKQIPKHLSEEAQRWWSAIVSEYSVDDEAGKLLLQTALESFDRMKAAARRINQDGEAVEDRFGQVKPHPLLTAERDARSQMLAALKQLNLDMEPLNDGPGRPPGR